MYFYITVLFNTIYLCQGWAIFFAIEKIEVTLKLGLLNIPVREPLILDVVSLIDFNQGRAL